MNASADVVVKLRDLRRFRGLSQRQLARKCRVGEKTISSFETGERIESMKLSQLRAIIAACGVSEKDFFTKDLEDLISAAASPVVISQRGINWYVEQVCAVLDSARRERINAMEILGAVRSIVEARHHMTHLKVAS